MRLGEVIYCGKISSHRYYHAYGYLGMIITLLIVEQNNKTGQSLAKRTDAPMAAPPRNGEIKTQTEESLIVIDHLSRHQEPMTSTIDRTEGVIPKVADWYIKLRCPHTEVLLRLNVETRGKSDSLDTHVADIETPFWNAE